MVVVKTEEDIAQIEFGTPYVIEVEGMPGADDRNPNPSGATLREYDRLQGLVEAKFLKREENETEEKTPPGQEKKQ